MANWWRMINYFELNNDIAFPNRWWLGKVMQIDGEIFVKPPLIPVTMSAGIKFMKLS